MGKFNFIKTALLGVYVIEPTVFGDSRGYFLETYHKGEFEAAGITQEFVQDNHSKSTKGVLRGLHFQKENTQGKLVRVTSGEVFDVAVDCRPNSPTFGGWVGELLSAENKKQLYMPEGFAHGFFVLSDEAEFIYKCTDIYNHSAECGIMWNDPDLGIVWPLNGAVPLLSDKDRLHKGFKEQAYKFFERW